MYLVPLIQTTFYNEDETKSELFKTLKNLNKLSMGEHCSSFECEFSKWQGRAYSVLVNSGSSANLALIQALLNLGYLKKGDRVGFSALTWATNVMPLIQLGLIPVPVDVEIDTLNVSLNTLKSVSDIKALFITNLLGLCSDLDLIESYCSDNNILLIEDNCESLGSEYKGKKLGNFSLASTFSFYVGHQMSTVEGGMICTDNKELSDMLKMVKAHGWQRDIDIFSDDFYERYTFYDLGYNLRPTEITGIIGKIQLKYLDKIIAKREFNFNYLKDVYKQRDIYNYKTEQMDIFSSFSIPIVCKSEETKNYLLEKAGDVLETRPIVGGNISSQPFFKKYVGEFKIPNASLIHQRGFYVANNPDLTQNQLNIIREILC